MASGHGPRRWSRGDGFGTGDGLSYLASITSRALWRGHDAARTLAWRHLDRLRRWRRPHPDRWRDRRVLHVTTSFDLGGTQTQIKHLCTASGSRFEHLATEIFPEMNFLYRTGAADETGRYVRGGPASRAVGRLVASRHYRASELVQAMKVVMDIHELRPSVVVGWGHEIAITTFLAAAIARVPHVVCCIRTANPGYGWTDPSSAARLRTAHRRIANQWSATIVNSTFLRADHARWLGVAEDRIAICANGIAAGTGDLTPRHETRARYGVPGDATVLVNVGRFSREKGQLSLLDATEQLMAAGAPKFAWLLCGDGPTLEPMRAQAASRGLDNIFFTGRTQPIAPVLAAADVFVMPSHYEGMPNAMMEAMAAGLPSVSTNQSGAMDVARDGIEALYYEPGDTPALVSHVLQLMRSPARARAMGAAAAARVATFSVARFVDCFDGVLDGMTAAGR
jgi:glycosyltransferase involved in cell wall biosynthesis